MRFCQFHELQQPKGNLNSLSIWNRNLPIQILASPRSALKLALIFSMHAPVSSLLVFLGELT